MSPLRRRLRAAGDGGCNVRLSRDERELLARLPEELDDVLGGLDGAPETIPDALRRLFPAAHPRDAEEEQAFVALARRDLLESHRSALAVLKRTAFATHLGPDELEGWLTALNELRLVLGTSLGVTEDNTAPPRADPRFPQWALYGYLSLLVDEAVDVLSGALPPAAPGADAAVPEDPLGEPPGGLRWDGTAPPSGP